MSTPYGTNPNNEWDEALDRLEGLSRQQNDSARDPYATQAKPTQQWAQPPQQQWTPTPAWQQPPQDRAQQQMQPWQGGAYPAQAMGQPKSKIAAALLAFFLGTLGVHNFYLGYTQRAVTQLVMTIVGVLTMVFIVGFFLYFAVGIWAFVEFIMILVGSQGYATDARGVPLTT